LFVMHANGADAKVPGQAHNVLDKAPCEAKEDFNPLTPNGLSYQCTPLLSFPHPWRERSTCGGFLSGSLRTGQ
jgi:hypothetical protein